MSLIVQKFGGTSVADADRIRNVARIITETYRKGHSVVAVLSAQGDTTDDLIEKAQEINPSASKREMDMLLATGEQISISLCAMAIERMGYQAVSLTGWQAGMLTDSSYSSARIKRIRTERIQKELGITTIIVTHDHEEAVSLADRVIVMNAGHILQIGKPQEVFDRPASPFIADFMGFSTFLHGIAAGAEGDMRLIRCGAHTLQVPAESARELAEGDACILAIRSENIQTAEQEGANTVRGTVKSATYKGHTTRLEVSGCFEEMVYPAIHEYADVQEGSEVLLHFPAQHFCVYKDIK